MQKDPILLLERFLLKNFGSDFLFIGKLKFWYFTREKEKEQSPRIAFVSPGQPRVIKPRARAMDKVAEPTLTHCFPPPLLSSPEEQFRGEIWANAV